MLLFEEERFIVIEHRNTLDPCIPFLLELANSNSHKQYRFANISVFKSLFCLQDLDIEENT